MWPNKSNLNFSTLLASTRIRTSSSIRNTAKLLLRKKGGSKKLRAVLASILMRSRNKLKESWLIWAVIWSSKRLNPSNRSTLSWTKNVPRRSPSWRRSSMERILSKTNCCSRWRLTWQKPKPISKLRLKSSKKRPNWERPKKLSWFESSRTTRTNITSLKSRSRSQVSTPKISRKKRNTTSKKEQKPRKRRH